MTRPKRLRLIESVPEVRWFKPAGIEMCALDEVTLTFDEIEAIRLADMEGLYQEQVAKRMNVSRQTIGRILSSARKKTAEALVSGKAIRLEGGEFHFRAPGVTPGQSGAQDESLPITAVNLGKKARFVAITAKEPNLDSDVDIRFGRAKYFIIVDTEDNSFQALANEAQENGASGVGVRNLKRVIEAGTDVIISGRVGQKVMSSLIESNITTYLVDGGSVKEVLAQYKIDHPAK